MVVERPRTARIAARAEVKERPNLIRAHREPFVLKIKDSSLRVTPGPNAPQLIRLVRYPFALDTVRNAKIPLGVARPEAREKFARVSGMHDAIADTIRPARVRATTRIRPTHRPRLRALGWLVDEQGER